MTTNDAPNQTPPSNGTGNTLDPTKQEFWIHKWENSQTRWDMSNAHPVIQYLVREKTLIFRPDELSDQSVDDETRKLLESSFEEVQTALVPGCGTGYDVGALAQWPQISCAIGADLSPIAMNKASELYANLVKEGKAKFIAGDFFKLHETYASTIDFIFDYTFLCAIHPSMRDAWAKEMSLLVKPGKFLLTMVFPIRPYTDDPTNPPYHVDPDHVTNLLTDSFELVDDVLVPDNYAWRPTFERLMLWRRRSS